MFYSHFCYEIYKWFKVWTELKHIKGVALSLILNPPLPPPPSPEAISFLNRSSVI